MSRKTHEYIVVEGPIGVGKTTLAARLAATFNNSLLLDCSSDNPFLPRFYENPGIAAFPTQLHFLLQRARQIQALRQRDLFKSAQVADFLIQKDKLFAEVTLERDELGLYCQVYDNLIVETPVPDLVIYLQAPVEVLLRRISKHGRDYEKKIEGSYLQHVSDAYVRFFYDYNASPLLIINAADLDLASDNGDYGLLLDCLDDLGPGRHYFNPQAL